MDLKGKIVEKRYECSTSNGGFIMLELKYESNFAFPRFGDQEHGDSVPSVTNRASLSFYYNGQLQGRFLDRDMVTCTKHLSLEAITALKSCNYDLQSSEDLKDKERDIEEILACMEIAEIRWRKRNTIKMVKMSVNHS
jgi:hypothetical protein